MTTKWLLMTFGGYCKKIDAAWLVHDPRVTPPDRRWPVSDFSFLLSVINDGTTRLSEVVTAEACEHCRCHSHSPGLIPPWRFLERPLPRVWLMACKFEALRREYLFQLSYVHKHRVDNLLGCLVLSMVLCLLGSKPPVRIVVLVLWTRRDGVSPLANLKVTIVVTLQYILQELQ